MSSLQTRTPEQYEAHKGDMREKSAARSRAGRDIGSIPAVVDPVRKSRALVSFKSFCEDYFPLRFKKSWGDHHLATMERVQTVVLDGGQYCLAMPRGDGKTTLIELAPLWALIIGAHSYVYLIGSSEPKAEEMLDSIKIELAYNHLLLEDFPEICYPIKMLEGEVRRCSGQIHHGRHTGIKWSPNEIKLPTIPGSQASGGVIRICGITGNIRGAVRSIPDERGLVHRVRPTLAVLDDPQTDESAYSPAQCEKRYRLVTQAVLGLAEAGESMSAMMPCTVIREDDLADRMLDSEKTPEWTGERTQMLPEFPKNMKLWEEYDEIRKDSLRRFKNIKKATEFYAENREAMDEGAVSSWAERYKRAGPNRELSSIQHAMNKFYADERAFWAECQNKPLPELPPDAEMLSIGEICDRKSGYPRGLVPADALGLVGGVDVQGDALYYTMLAYGEDFTCWIVDYGVFPEQRSDYYTLSTLRRTLSMQHPKESVEGRIYEGLKDLYGKLCGEWDVEGGGVIRPSRVLVDANWGLSTDTVYRSCRSSDYSSSLTPGHGRYVGASSTPMNEYKKKRGDKIGHNWIRPSVAGRRTVRHIKYDTNYWKSFLHSRLGVSPGDRGSLTIFDPDKKGQTHRVIAEHLTSEHRVKTEGRGRTVDEWKYTDRSRDNHLLDTTTASLVAASVEGASMPEIRSGKSSRRERRGVIVPSEIQSRKQRA